MQESTQKKIISLCGTPAFIRGDLPESIAERNGREMFARHDYIDVEKVICKKCNGKGEVTTACRDCNGRGVAIDKKRSLLHGVPVQKVCDRCNGKGFSRLPTTLARARVARLVPDMTDYQWYNGYADVINKLVTKCWQEETYAETKLKEVTR